jgi:hypothetical protein
MKGIGSREAYRIFKARSNGHDVQIPFALTTWLVILRARKERK